MLSALRTSGRLMVSHVDRPAALNDELIVHWILRLTRSKCGQSAMLPCMAANVACTSLSSIEPMRRRVVVEFGGSDVARSRQIDGDYLLDTARTGGHDGDAVAEQNRLLDIVSDEYRQSAAQRPRRAKAPAA